MVCFFLGVPISWRISQKPKTPFRRVRPNIKLTSSINHFQLHFIPAFIISSEKFLFAAFLSP